MTFDEFSLSLVIAQTTYNRRAISEISLSNMAATRGLATHWVYDDHSTQMTVEELQAMAPGATVVRHPKKLGIHRLREHLHHEALKAGFKFIYHTDNDALHDPNWLARMFDIWVRHGRPVGLYNTGLHRIHTMREEGDVIIRKHCPGISMMYEFASVPPIPSVGSEWDMNFGRAFKEFAISKESFVEHFGADGIHNKDHERDRAKDPTPWLKAERPRVLETLGVKPK